MKKAIVTGADGFVGSYVVKELLENDYFVIAVDIGHLPIRLDTSNSKLRYISHSVDDLSFLSQEHEVDVFYHFAWRGSAGPERCDEQIQLNNALLTARCLRFAASIGVKRFVVAGTIMEFETNQVVYEQGSQPALPYIYGAGKTVAHEICKPIANDLGIDLLWTYITNTYGVGESSQRFLNNTIKKIIHGDKLEFTSGNQNYDFIYVTDVARAFRLVGEKGIANKGYLIGSGKARPLKEFVMEMCNAIDPRIVPVFGDVPYTGVMTPIEIFSINDLQVGLGFVPQVSFRDGIRRTYKYLKELENRHE